MKTGIVDEIVKIEQTFDVMVESDDFLPTDFHQLICVAKVLLLPRRSSSRDIRLAV